MRKSIYRQMLFVLFCVAIAFSNTITVNGKANVEGRGRDAKAAARTSALANADREAIEQALTLFLGDDGDNPQFTDVKDAILSAPNEFITNKVVVRDVISDDNSVYMVSVDVTVNSDKISEEFNDVMTQVKSTVGNPAITFVITTYEKVGEQTRTSSDRNSSRETTAYDNQSGSASASAEANRSDYETNAHMNENQNSNSNDNSSSNNSSDNSSRSGEKNDGGYNSDQSSGNANSGSSNNANANSSMGASESGSEGQASANASSEYDINDSRTTGSNTTASSENISSSIDERLWKKMSDATVIDAFQQEFLEKNFDLMAADNARQIALASSDVTLDINPMDRQAVREAAEREGANYVARGEVKIIDTQRNSSGHSATVALGVEIIDVNSGQIVASYSNTASAINTSADEAIVQAINKVAILGARTLADQTVVTWNETATLGATYTIILENFTSIRSQQRPFMLAVEEVASQVVNTTSPDETTLLMRIMYTGSKDDLGWAILDIVGVRPGFEEGVFDGPVYSGGTLTYKFLQ